MKVYLNEITGIADAITSMYFSKRTWSRAKEDEIRTVCNNVLSSDGCFIGTGSEAENNAYTGWMATLVKWGCIHPTMLRFIDLSFTVEGLHRAGQDDWDAHAKRFNNRIIRSSTRLAEFGAELSSWYQGKVIPTDTALELLGINLPETTTREGIPFVRTTGGYIREDLADDKDVKRGLYTLGIPSNFTYKVDVVEFAHVYKERNVNGTAHPEVKELCERSTDLIQEYQPWFNRELLLAIKN